MTVGAWRRYKGYHRYHRGGRAPKPAPKEKITREQSLEKRAGVTTAPATQAPAPDTYLDEAAASDSAIDKMRGAAEGR